MINIRQMTQQQAVELMAYHFKENKAYMQRLPCMNNGPRWKWYKGRLWLQGGIGEKLVPPRPCMYPEAKTSKDWAVFAEEEIYDGIWRGRREETTTYYGLEGFLGATGAGEEAAWDGITRCTSAQSVGQRT